MEEDESLNQVADKFISKLLICFCLFFFNMLLSDTLGLIVVHTQRGSRQSKFNMRPTNKLMNTYHGR